MAKAEPLLSSASRRASSRRRARAAQLRGTLSARCLGRKATWRPWGAADREPSLARLAKEADEGSLFRALLRERDCRTPPPPPPPRPAAQRAPSPPAPSAESSKGGSADSPGPRQKRWRLPSRTRPTRAGAPPSPKLSHPTPGGGEGKGALPDFAGALERRGWSARSGECPRLRSHVKPG